MLVWQCFSRPLRKRGIDDGLDSLAQELDELRVHEGHVGDVEDDDFFVGDGFAEVLAEAFSMLVLHDEDEIGPSEHLVRDASPRGGAGASAGDLEAWIVSIKGLRSGAAPLIARAEEEDVEHGTKGLPEERSV